jgi:hypothetical protein
VSSRITASVSRDFLERVPMLGDDELWNMHMKATSSTFQERQGS